MNTDMIRGHYHIPDAGWFSSSGSPVDLDKMAYYRVVTTDHTSPMYPETLITCKHCGTKHNIQNMDVLSCERCGAPL
jgi:hypothetical protein